MNEEKIRHITLISAICFFRKLCLVVDGKMLVSRVAPYGLHIYLTLSMFKDGSGSEVMDEWRTWVCVMATGKF